MSPYRLAWLLILYFLACGLALTLYSLDHPALLYRLPSLPLRTHSPASPLRGRGGLRARAWNIWNIAELPLTLTLYKG